MSDDKKQLGTRVQNYIDRLKELHSDRIVIEKPEDFQNSKLKINFVCKDHGIFNTDLKSLLRVRNGIVPKGCPICANISRAKNLTQPANNYLESLLENEPDYEWAEEYKGSNKVLHKLKHKKCGIVRNIRPNDFQQGCSRCTCKPATEKKVSPKSKTRLYVCELYDKERNEVFIKVGIKSAHRNFEVYKYDVLLEKEFGTKVKDLEQVIHYNFSDNSYKPKISFAGYTECFDLSVKDEILEFIRSLKK